MFYPETQLILTFISLFCKLHCPLLHGPISNTTRFVPIAHYCLPYWLDDAACLYNMLCMAKGVQVALVNKSKPVCWLQVMNTMTSKVILRWWTYYTNGPDDVRHPMMMTNYVQLFVCIVIITDGIVRLCKLILLINTLCLMNVLVLVWLL